MYMQSWIYTCINIYTYTYTLYKLKTSHVTHQLECMSLCLPGWVMELQNDLENVFISIHLT